MAFAAGLAGYTFYGPAIFDLLRRDRLVSRDLREPRVESSGHGMAALAAPTVWRPRLVYRSPTRRTHARPADTGCWLDSPGSRRLRGHSQRLLRADCAVVQSSGSGLVSVS